MAVDKKKVIKKVVKKATKKIVKKTAPGKSIKKSDLVKKPKSAGEVAPVFAPAELNDDKVLKEFLEAVAKSGPQDGYKNRFSRDSKQLHSAVKLKPEYESLDDTTGMWEEMELKLKSLDEDNLKHFNYKEGLRALAKDMFSLSDQEVAYIHSYVKIFKAKKEFERLRVQVGDDKI